MFIRIKAGSLVNVSKITKIKIETKSKEGTEKWYIVFFLSDNSSIRIEVYEGEDTAHEYFSKLEETLQKHNHTYSRFC